MKYTVYATTVNVYKVEVQAEDENEARDKALDIWDAKALTGFTEIDRDCDFEVNQAVEEGTDDPELNYMLAVGFERQRA
jgi:hypothetical protein